MIEAAEFFIYFLIFCRKGLFIFELEEKEDVLIK